MHTWTTVSPHHDFWRYRLDDHSPCRHPASELPSQPHPERAGPATLDCVYRAHTALSVPPDRMCKHSVTRGESREARDSSPDYPHVQYHERHMENLTRVLIEMKG